MRTRYKNLLGLGLAGLLFFSNSAFAYAQEQVINLEVNGTSYTTENVTNTDYGNEVKEFTNEVEKVDDYAIYTNELTNTIGHEDGNVMIGQADQSTIVMVKGDSQGNQGEVYDNNVKSIVASTSDENVVIQFNDNNTSTNPTTNFKTLEYGAGVNVADTTNGCNYVELTEEATAEVIEEIGNQLDSLAAEGQDIIVSNTYTAADGVQAIKSVATYLNENKDLDSTDTITITIPSSTLSDDSLTNEWNNNKIIKQIIDANKNGVQVVINVSTAADDAEIVINRNMSNEVEQYGATNLIWNFGEYAGTIKGAQIIGTVIAGNATVSVKEVQSGSIAADKVGHTAEVHLYYDGEKPSTPEPSEPENPDIPSEPDKPSEPDVPSTPDTPDVPSEPEEPNTPEEPDEPIVPTEPEVPTTPTNTITIEDTAVPLAVLGANRVVEIEDDTDEAIEVLGANRSPKTGYELDVVNYSLFALAIVLCGCFIVRGRKRCHE